MIENIQETVKNLLITDEWYEKCEDKKNITAFNIFCAAFSHNNGNVTKVCLEELTQRMDDLCVKSDKIEKLFDYIYVYNDQDQYTFITGFCDMTDFIKCIKNKDDKDYFSTIIKLFLANGGIIRYNNKDYLSEDLAVLWNAIKPNLP